MPLGRRSHLHAPRARGGAGGPDRSACVLLTRIPMHGPTSIGQLSDAFGPDASTLHRQTAALLRSGVVERIPDPDGVIAREFRLTEEGERRPAADRSYSIGGLRRIMEHRSPADATRFVDLLEGRPWPRS
ncbi:MULTISPECIES: MarR family winged helix-turn-helix transcriptional regulator [Streptomyces]|uniref:MarR family winged helix-turn-helix transcriptional regulator n=2 Tax=Streptomyces TaxID=1883 RepID=A0ABU4KBH1_9ACTN|nr:MarR family winged helix-turn-helix transcriptional regulator [Streptomyces roseolus]MDX2295062.1 MarR family winged helix-turn-helix transcriptional regulator [Streptomyces roseolus]